MFFTSKQLDLAWRSLCNPCSAGRHSQNRDQLYRQRFASQLPLCLQAALAEIDVNEALHFFCMPASWLPDELGKVGWFATSSVFCVSYMWSAGVIQRQRWAADAVCKGLAHRRVLVGIQSGECESIPLQQRKACISRVIACLEIEQRFAQTSRLWPSARNDVFLFA